MAIDTIAAPVSIPMAPPSEPITVIKPSEAIRLGRLKFPRFVAMHWFDSTNTASCTAGAMAAGYGVSRRGGIRANLSNHIAGLFNSPTLNQFVAQIPVMIDCGEMTEAEIISVLEEAGY